MRAHDADFFALPITFFFSIALVMLFFAFGEANLYLDAAFGKVHIERHNGIACALYFGDETGDLFVI
jgi:hypothetical protein